MVTAQELQAQRTPAGGWTREQLTEWGVPWPPPKGWKAALIAKAQATTDVQGPRVAK
ncbi:hypothetical protein GCM10025779_09150 [Arthrobacter cryoconiti]